MPGRAWLLVAMALAIGAMVAWIQPANVQAAMAWQPELAAREPWRAISAAWLHWSPQHLIANLAGCAVIGLLGVAARLQARDAVAWLLAWPLTQIGLLIEPALWRFGGASGVLHAGVAVAAVGMMRMRVAHGRQRVIGLLIGLGLAVKVAAERPLSGPPLRHWDGWNIAIAPLAHLTGALAGVITGVAMSLLCALAARAWTHRRA
ncbi:rhomboid family intramembrane serine protease [Roseateles sp. MS654]|jgi:rhomboid family GlyGly-CTERM serine protease|uniref:rhomboid family intramembrane serine protease n=1 Tax=Roseateles sp. MS654 TaxID=3412685 RepID=UPI003C2FD997